MEHTIYCIIAIYKILSVIFSMSWERKTTLEGKYKMNIRVQLPVFRILIACEQFRAVVRTEF